MRGGVLVLHVLPSLPKFSRNISTKKQFVILQFDLILSSAWEAKASCCHGLSLSNDFVFIYIYTLYLD